MLHFVCLTRINHSKHHALIARQSSPIMFHLLGLKQTVIQQGGALSFSLLLNLPWCVFLSCIFCGPTTTSIKKLISGTLLKVVQTCKSCLKKRLWQSQPRIGTVPLGNIRMSASILFSGSLPSKVFRMFEIFDIHTITRATFFRHQERYYSLQFTLCGQNNSSQSSTTWKKVEIQLQWLEMGELIA